MIRKYNITESVTLYRSGNPFHTGAVILKTDTKTHEETKGIGSFAISKTAEGTKISGTFTEGEIVYGLGESMGGINKRGRRYKLYSNDDPMHTPNVENLYGAHPFMIFSSESGCYGVFIDFPGLMEIDLGFTKISDYSITITSADFDFYIINGRSPDEIITAYLTLTGKPFLPPKWAFGFQQSRWSYPDEAAILKVVESFSENGIPVDAIYVDIDYMDNYKVFTVNKNNFKDFKKLTSDLKSKEGIRLLPIIDPGVRVEKNYDVYEECIKNKYYVENKDKSPFLTAVWPGMTIFPDFTRADVRKWWGKKYINFFQDGIDGFWNDMNEPAIFYTPEFLEFAIKTANTTEIKNSWDYFKIRDNFMYTANRRDYYEKMFHLPDSIGNKPVSNDKIHNLFGYYMTMATADAVKEHLPDLRYFLLSRSSYAGMHRFAAIWTGDNQSWWEHMTLNIKMLISLNICGFFYTGADIGGFGGNVSNELIIRWMQLGIFNPLFRNHSALGTRDQEPYNFDNETINILKNAVKLRYALVPYIYSEFIDSINNLKPFIKPISFITNDKNAVQIEDQFMLGSSIMAIPVHTANTTKRTVYIPENTRWLLCKFKSHDDYTVSILNGGIHLIDVQLDEVPLLIKENSIIPITNPEGNISKSPITNLNFIGFVTDQAEFTYYNDDGETNNYLKGEFMKLTATASFINGKIETKHSISDKFNLSKIKSVNFLIYDENANLLK